MSDPKKSLRGQSLRLAEFRLGDFDRGAPKIIEGLWILTSAVFFLPPLPLPSSFRASLLRLFGASIGQRTVIRSGVKIKFPWKLRLGDDVWLGEGVEILNLAQVDIGRDCCLSQGAFLCTGSHDFRQPRFNLITEEICINSGCWIAARAFVGPGVLVGEDSMIGACCVVTKNVPKLHYAYGNPSSMRAIPTPSTSS